VKLRIFPQKRSRFDQCRRKLGILRKKRGREATGDSLLQSMIESLKHRNYKAAVAEVEKYLLLLQDLTPEERAIADGLCCELRKLADTDATFGRFVKVAVWFLDVAGILRRAVSPLISHTARKLMCSRRYCHEGFARTVRRESG